MKNVHVFTVAAGNGSIYVRLAVLDYEAKTAYNLTVIVTDR